MEKKVFVGTIREVTGKQVKAARRAGKLPAVVYGKTLQKPLPIFLEGHETELKIQGVSPTTLVDVVVDGKTYPVLVRETQRDVIYRHLLHVDFLAVSMTETLRAFVQIELAGNSPAVKEHGAILVTGLEEVEIECLPGDLPENLTIDVSGLKEIGDSLHVKDLEIPERVTLLSDPDEIIVFATAPMAEEAEEVEVEVAEPERVDRARIEEGEAEEEE
jgi:large subunit ribosomal protein L25